MNRNLRKIERGLQKGKNRTLFSFAIGALVALGVFFLLQNNELFDSFQANILSLQNKDILIEHNRDVGYKTDNYVLDVYLSDAIHNYLDNNNIKKIDSLEIEILFDELNVFFDFDALERQGNLELIGKEEGRYILLSRDVAGIDYNESLFVLPYAGDGSDLLLGSVIAFDKKGSPIQLSVGNLNTKNINDQVHRN